MFVVLTLLISVTVRAVPLPTEGAAPPSIDCALNGARANGACSCFGPWRGSDCSELALGFVPAASGYGLSPPLRSSWGGNVLQVSGQFHLYVAEMAENCSLATWGGNSLITHATAASAEGPFIKRGSPAIGVWRHNPQNCSWPQEPLDGARGPRAAGSTVHTSATIDGPWIPLMNSSLPSCNNPAPMLHPNGTLYVVCGSSQIFSAPHITGPWHRVDTPSFDDHSNGPAGAYEDAFLWVDPRGAWHALFHVWNEEITPTCANSTVSAHAFSIDGLVWRFSPRQPYNTTVALDDGTTFITPTRERPKLLFGADGEASHLYNGAVRDMESCVPHWCSHCKVVSNHTFTLATPLLR